MEDQSPKGRPVLITGAKSSEKKLDPKSFRLLHGLRHHFGSVHAANGTPMPVLQKLMRHSEIKTTMIYVEINQNELEEAAQKTVELLDFRLEK